MSYIGHKPMAVTKVRLFAVFLGVIKAQYIVDDNGSKISVVLPFDVFKKMQDDLDEFACIKMYDKAKSVKQEFIPTEKAFAEIEQNRK